MRVGLRESRERFYESYRSSGGQCIPEEDTTTEKRKSLLADALDRLGKGADADQRVLKILDAGCGNGEFSEFIGELGFEVVGIDISESAIKMAKDSSSRGSFHVGSLEDKLPFNEGEFAAIWSTEVLEHIFDVHACLSEFNRVLQESGLLIITVPYHGMIKNLALALAGFERHYNPYLSHIRFFSQRSLTNCLIQAGFEPLRWKGIGRFWPFNKSFFVVSRKVGAPGSMPEIIG